MTHTSEIPEPTYDISARWGWLVIDHRMMQPKLRTLSYYYTIPLVKRKPRDA
jgi:hypothetical protein